MVSAVLARRRGRDSDESSATGSKAPGTSSAQGARKKVARTMVAGAGASTAHAAAGAQMTASSTQHNVATDGVHGSAHTAAPETTVSRPTDTQNFFSVGTFSAPGELFCAEVLHASGAEHTTQTTEQGRRTQRRTDAVLSLTTQAYEAMAVQLRCARWHAERQEAGRLAHARRRRGDG